jgi:hypothetical protein
VNTGQGQVVTGEKRKDANVPTGKKEEQEADVVSCCLSGWNE